MISTGQILAAGVITGISVAMAAAAVRWRMPAVLAASLGALALIVAWRALSNLLGLNGDFVPAVSMGDVLCVVAGAAIPAAIGATRLVPDRRRWVSALAGGLVGLLVNVVIL
jgi:hypothetical protein